MAPPQFQTGVDFSEMEFRMTIKPGDIAFVAASADRLDTIMILVRKALAGGTTFLIGNQGHAGKTGARPQTACGRNRFLRYTAPAAGVDAGSTLIFLRQAKRWTVDLDRGGLAGRVTSNPAFVLSSENESLTAYAVSGPDATTGATKLLAFVTWGHGACAPQARASKIPTLPGGQALILPNPPDRADFKIAVPGEPLSLTIEQLSDHVHFQQSSSPFGVRTVACFFPGARIATPGGPRPVERLVAGDLVLTRDGDAAPVLWMGRQTISTRFGNPLHILPIRIRAGALASNLPERDLLVSPDHALFIDGVLIHAGALVNGASVAREANTPEIFTYWHIETAEHTLVLAEGIPTETFVDRVDRLAFDNWHEHDKSAPPPPVAEMPWPRAARHAPAAIRQKLEARARALAAGAGYGAVA